MKREQLDVAGLSAPAEIAIDTWGIPHIRAENLDDLFFAQGFNAARDRLWQIDLWRKQGLGLLAADFGPGFLAAGLRAGCFSIAATWSANGRPMRPDAKAICSPSSPGSTPIST